MKAFYHRGLFFDTKNHKMSYNYKNFTLKAIDFIKNQYIQILILLGLVNTPYILIKIYWDNKIPTLFYICLGLLAFMRIFYQNQTANESFKRLRAKYPHYSKQKVVDMVQTKKAQIDGAFFLSFIILIFSFVLI